MTDPAATMVGKLVPRGGRILVADAEPTGTQTDSGIVLPFVASIQPGVIRGIVVASDDDEFAAGDVVYFVDAHGAYQIADVWVVWPEEVLASEC